LAEFNHIASLQRAQRFRGGPCHALHEELEHTTSRSQLRRRCNGEERGLGRVGYTELEVLPGECVGRGEVRRVGHVDGDVEERLGGWLDLGEWGWGPDGSVLTNGGGNGGEAAAGAKV